MNAYHLKYSISEAEFLEAYEAHWRIKKQSSKSNLIYGVVALLLGGALYFYIGWIGVLLAAVGAILIVMVMLRRFLHIRAYRENKKYRDQIEVVFTEEKIEVRSNDGESKLNWSVFQKYVDTQHFLLLYISSNSFSIIPKQAFKDDLDPFLEFAKNKISQPDGGINSEAAASP